MLRANTSGGTVRSTEDDRAWDISSGHIMRLAGGIDDLVDGLHGEVESHELASIRVEVNSLVESTHLRDVHWSEASQSSTSRNTREPHLGNRCVDDALLTKLVQQTFGDLLTHVGTQKLGPWSCRTL